jgi:hypothetical protein
MNEPENNPQSGTPDAGLEDKCRELGRIVNVLFAALVITSFTLTAYLAVQASRTSGEATQAKAQADKYMEAVDQDNAKIRGAFDKLLEFAHKHPDFYNQVLAKYKNNTTAPFK